MVKATEKRIYLTRHAQAEHKYVIASHLCYCSGLLMHRGRPCISVFLSSSVAEDYSSMYLVSLDSLSFPAKHTHIPISLRCPAHSTRSSTICRLARDNQGHDSKNRRTDRDQCHAAPFVYDGDWVCGAEEEIGSRGKTCCCFASVAGGKQHLDRRMRYECSVAQSLSYRGR